MSHHDGSNQKCHRRRPRYGDRDSPPPLDQHEGKRRRRSPVLPSSSSSLRRKRTDFDFEAHKGKLTRIFFRPDSTDLIQAGSQEHRDFWKFLKHLEKRRNRSESVSSGAGQCFQLLPMDSKDLLNRIPLQGGDRDEGVVTEEMVMAFRSVLTLYVDFLQREKFSKLKKLRTSQADLPIAQHRQELIKAVKDNQVVIVAGDTGCGKSTQVPRYLLHAGYSNIACTQPRRNACVALANRVSFETLNCGSEGEIGFQIRFERRKTDRTKILFLTEGLLLRQLQSESTCYDVIILDEVHERHLHGDFLLGAVRCLTLQSKDLKVILMSATINVKLFGDYFDGQAPVIQVPGRLHPIQLIYRPIPVLEKGSSSEKLNPAPYVRVLQLIDAKYPSDERGDLLMFLSGIQEITAVVNACKEYSERKKNGKKWIVLALHSTLSLDDQDKVFDYAPDGARKCIVSTNIAETSVTIDGVRFVADSGKVKEMQYDAVCKMSRLKEVWASQASAEQRKGRAGRTGPGVCFRLYDESDYNAMDPYSTPEIRRVPLDGTVLQMVSMGMADARKFPFVEPPPPDALESAILSLKEAGAMNNDETLTVDGRMLAKLPVDVRVGKMLIAGTMFHQVDAVLTVAAALSVQSPFTNDAFRDRECVEARRNLDSDHGDPITLLNSYGEWLSVKAGNRESSRRWCRKRGLEEQRFYEMTKLRQQFNDVLVQSGLLDNVGEEPSSSGAERAVRHGELKKLRSLKREYRRQNEQGSRKKKFLTLSSSTNGNEDEKDDAIDIKDVEFRLRNDDRKVRALLESSKTRSRGGDLTILKLILCSGLYPQFAVADQFNNATKEQLFHTRTKPFNVLHPNCIFASNPDLLAVEELDVVRLDAERFPDQQKHPFSAKHQILVHLSLLETNKPYVVNATRMPALQTLMLFSRHVHTNSHFTRIVFDSWLEVRLVDGDEALLQVAKASMQRNVWSRLSTLRLQASLDDVVQRDEDDLEAMLANGLVDLVRSEPIYSLKRLLPGDLKVIYNRKRIRDVDANPFDFDNNEDTKPDDDKGGIRLAQHLLYGCLKEDEHRVDSSGPWTCPVCCDNATSSSVLVRLQHLCRCLKKTEKDAASIKRRETERERQKANPNSKEHRCRDCQQTFYFTPMQLLRHNKLHVAKSEETAKQ